MTDQLADRGRRTVTGLAAVLALVFVVSLGSLLVHGPATVGDLDALLYVVSCLAGAGLLVARAVLVPCERATWLCLAALLVCNAAAGIVWSLGFSESELSPADAVWGAGNVFAFVGIGLYLRHRVGDAYRAFWLDAVGITVSLAAIFCALLIGPIVDHGHVTAASAALNLLYPASAAAVCSVVLAAGSMSGRSVQRQDALLGGAFVVVCAVDVVYALYLAGVLGSADLIIGVGWQLGAVMIAAAAWTRPSTAGALRVGGWWELGPTLAWMAAGTGVLVLAAFTQLSTVAIAAAGAVIALAALRTVLVTRDVRNLIVHRRLALTDDLTGLPNRRALQRRLELLTRDGGRAGQSAALLIADLDGFKELNDALGHSAGDALLVEIGRRLAAVPGAETVRLGGDEFAAIVEAPHDPRAVAAELLDALSLPVALHEISVGVAASIGIARYPEDATSSGGLLRRADVAMYDAKRRRAGVATYAPERDGFTRTRVALAADLQRGVHDPAAAGLWIAFQPQVRMDTRAICGVEALVRWTHPTQGLVSPAELLRLAARTGTLTRLTDWIIDESVGTAAAWHAAGHPSRISVNVSALTLIDAGLPARIAATLARHGLPGEALVVEVTEDAVMSDPKRCCEVLDALTAQGIGISVDDFGTGQSSLTQLRRIGATELKIDRSFVLGMTSDRFDREVVVAVAGMGVRLGMRLVAEGVENPATWQALRAVGCDLAQGFGIARPMPREQLLELLAGDPVTLGSAVPCAPPRASGSRSRQRSAGRSRSR